MPKPKIKPEIGQSAIQRATSGDAESMALAVRYTLQVLAAKSPGHSVEVRIPPFAAAQCIAGPVHRRGTPANAVECPPLLWLELCLGKASWNQAVAEGTLLASGTRSSEVATLLPLFN